MFISSHKADTLGERFEGGVCERLHCWIIPRQGCGWQMILIAFRLPVDRPLEDRIKIPFRGPGSDG